MTWDYVEAKLVISIIALDYLHNHGLGCIGYFKWTSQNNLGNYLGCCSQTYGPLLITYYIV